MRQRGQIVRIILTLLVMLVVGSVGLGLAGSGTPVLRTVAIAADPRAIVADAVAGHLFVYSNSGTISMLNVQSGSVMRTLAVEPYLGAYALASDERAGLVFLVGRLTGVQVLDARTGKRLHLLPVPSPQGPYTPLLAIDAQRTRVLLTDTAGKVLLVFDPRSGHLLRTRRLAGRPTAIAADARSGYAFVALDTGVLDTINETTGRVLHVTPVGASATAIAVDSGANRIVVLSQRANGAAVTTLLDMRSGAVVSISSMGRGSTSMTVDARTHRTFVAEFANSSVSVLDTRSGAVLRTVTVARVPIAVVDDEHGGHVFVVCFNPSVGWFGLGHSTHFDLLVDLVVATLHFGSPNAGAVNVLDARTGVVTRTIHVGRSPIALGVDATADRVLIADTADSTVSLLNDQPSP